MYIYIYIYHPRPSSSLPSPAKATSAGAPRPQGLTVWATHGPKGPDGREPYHIGGRGRLALTAQELTHMSLYI